MIDDDTRLLVGAYHDGELSPGEALAMRRRLDVEPALRAEYEGLAALSRDLRVVPAWPVPATMPMKAVGALKARVWPVWPLSRPIRHAMAAALLAGFVGGALIGGGGVYLHRTDSPVSTLDAVLSGHLRALAAPQPFDIASSDRHVVKPWFNGRTTLAPDAPDLATQGFPLVGGRIDVVEGRSVPTLVYRRDRHLISVTITPKAAGAPEGEDRRNGSTVEHWSAGDLTYWAVSDLNRTDLQSFEALFRARLAPAPSIMQTNPSAS